MGTGALSAGVERLGREADHSPLSSAKVKNALAVLPLSPVRLHGVVLNSALDTFQWRANWLYRGTTLPIFGVRCSISVVINYTVYWILVIVVL
jgi:hypothetical protein